MNILATVTMKRDEFGVYAADIAGTPYRVYEAAPRRWSVVESITLANGSRMGHIHHEAQTLTAALHWLAVKHQVIVTR